MQAGCARAGEILAFAPLDDGDVDPRQRQFTRQHETCRTSSNDHHLMLGHRHTPAVPAAATSSAAHNSHVGNNTRISDPVGSGFGRRFYRMTRVLKQAPRSPHIRLKGVTPAFPSFSRQSEVVQMTLQCRLLADAVEEVVLSSSLAIRELLAVPLIPIDAIKAANTKASTSAQLEEPKAPQHACPCCGSRMRIIETFWPGQQPKHHSSPLPRPIRIDTS